MKPGREEVFRRFWAFIERASEDADVHMETLLMLELVEGVAWTEDVIEYVGPRARALLGGGDVARPHADAAWYHAHPAHGLLRVAPDRQTGDLPTYTDERLGTRWVGLDDDEQEAAEIRFFQHLLRLVASGRGRFVADMPLERERERFDRIPGVTSSARGEVRGALTPQAVDALVRTNPEVVDVWVDGIHKLQLHDGWTGVYLLAAEGEAERWAGSLAAAGEVFTGP